MGHGECEGRGGVWGMELRSLRVGSEDGVKPSSCPLTRRAGERCECRPTGPIGQRRREWRRASCDAHALALARRQHTAIKE
eukprot:scaffold10425_cov114-Isochrysis_galbana.AAC.6